ncbi:cell division protein FtsN [Mangrovibacter phragmitis]|uniref:cell division protein FtsN n=1 Tax=Mangrovibacter phragmitis TaxID=1691903 RepID=UPI00351951FE
MAQRDYVRRGQSTPARRKKGNSRKKQTQGSALSPVMVAVAAAVLVAFVGGLYFITHHKKEESEARSGQSIPGNGLPPKPEERWRYIKELENRQPGIRTPTEPSSGGEIKNADQLTNEQRQLLEQMQADMRQQPTQLSEVPWNEQTPEQRQQTLQRQRQAAAIQQQAQPSGTSSRSSNTQSQPSTTRNTQTYSRSSPVRAPTSASPYEDLMQTPAHTSQREQTRSTTATRTEQPAPVTQVQEPAKTAEKKDERRWMIQCGSFRGADQAETVRAQLAFEGFSSHITVNNGWNRVVIGPLKGKENADSTISRLKVSGHANCIRIASGG